MKQPFQTGAMAAVLMAIQDNLRQVSELLEGEVTYLRGNGWTDDQARAIVARMWGWRPPDDAEDDPTDPGGEENRRV